DGTLALKDARGFPKAFGATGRKSFLPKVTNRYLAQTHSTRGIEKNGELENRGCWKFSMKCSKCSYEHLLPCQSRRKQFRNSSTRSRNQEPHGNAPGITSKKLDGLSKTQQGLSYQHRPERQSTWRAGLCKTASERQSKIVRSLSTVC